MNTKDLILFYSILIIMVIILVGIHFLTSDVIEIETECRDSKNSIIVELTCEKVIRCNGFPKFFDYKECKVKE